MATRRGCQKPAKPYDDFPLFAHSTRRWAKKIRGVMRYFGPWGDPQGALDKYLREKDALHAGRTPGREPGETTVKDVVNAFLGAKQDRVESGELSPRTWRDYKETCDLLIERIGKRRLVIDLDPRDFAAIRNAMAKRWGLHRIAKNVQYTRSVFKFALESGLIDKPVRFGPSFARPSKKSFRLEKAKQGTKLFTPKEIADLLEIATTPMRAMILLGLNCGYGNQDCATLTLSALDGEWVTFARPKTGLDRRCWLWPETRKAIKEWLDLRPAPKDPADVDLVFVTKYGQCWAKDTSSNPVSAEMGKLLRQLGLSDGRSFYTLRHTHRTVSDGARDQRAASFIMGHVDSSMSAIYVETIEDERIRAVAEHVRRWAFPTAKSKAKPPAEPDAVAQQAALEWNGLYSGAVAIGDYEQIRTRNDAILQPLTREQVHGVAALCGYTCRKSDGKADLISGMGRRIAERLGSHERNQFRGERPPLKLHVEEQGGAA